MSSKMSACGTQTLVHHVHVETKPAGGRAPFMVQWMRGYAPVPKGSVMWDQMGTYVALSDTHWSPCSDQGEKDWYKFNWADVIRAGEMVACGCSFIFPKAVPVGTATTCSSVAAMLYAKGAVVCHDGKLWAAKNANVPFDPANTTNWCGGITTSQIIAKLLCNNLNGELG